MNEKTPNLTRREFIVAGIGVAAVAATAPMLLRDGGRKFVATVMPLYKVIHDRRFEAGRMFGEEAGRLGAAVHAIDGEVHDLWYGDLYHRWKSAPAAIAGMTTHESFLPLAMMAQDARMRIVYRAYQPPGSVGKWSREAARIVTSWPAGQASANKAQSDIAYAHECPPGCDGLLAWVIAPTRIA